ncbi:MAG: histidine kinase [Chloroflexota bacterium]
MVRKIIPNLGSIRYQLTLVVLAATLPMMIFVGLFANQQRQAERVEIEKQMLFSAKTAAMGYDSLVLNARQTLQAAAGLSSLQTGELATCGAELDGLRRQFPIYLGISVNSPQGKVLCSSPRLPPGMNGKQDDQEWFSRAVQQQDFSVGSYTIGPVSHKGNLTFGYPVYDGSGQLQYVLGLGVDIEAINTSASRLALPEGSALRLSDRSGRIILRSPDPERYVGRIYPEFEILGLVENQPEGVAVATGLDRQPRIYGYTTLPSDPHRQLVLAVGIPTGQAYQSINRSLVSNLVAIASLGLLGMALSWVITERYILRPASILTQASRRLTAGDLNARAGLGRGAGEIYELGQDFDQMAESLQQQEAQLRCLNQELEQRVAARTAELRESRDLLQQYSNYLQNVLEEERKKISREIHDELGQALTGLKMDLRSIKKLLPPDQQQVDEKIAASLQLIDSTIVTMRRISSDLRPGVLDDLGLIAAVEWLVSNFEARTGIEVQLEVDPPEIEIPREMHTGMYRIIQEALTNVMRHSQATQVSILIQGRPDAVRIEISDNGRGFDEQVLFAQSRSLGLTGIRERATLIGGEATIIGKTGAGTQVIVCVPVASIGGIK